MSFGFRVLSSAFRVFDKSIFMATVTRFEDLEVWKLAREFAHEIFLLYTASENFSKDYQLKNQINASSGSIMDNIAEGFERGSRNEFIQFLSIAKASASETQSQLYRALDRQYMSQDAFDALYQKAQIICNKIGSFIKYLNGSDLPGNKFKNRQPTQNTKPQTPNPKP